MIFSGKKCVPCEGGLLPLTKNEAESFMENIPGWDLSSDGDKISRRFEFNDFVASLEFVNCLGSLAEEEGHHPDISFGWGYARVEFITHAINGLHENDFIMAFKTNMLFKEG